MGVWAWARRVASDHGGGVAIELAPEPAESDGRGYCLRLSGTETCVPVSVTDNPHPHPVLREIHACEVAGRRLEAESEPALRAKVRAAIERIAPGGELPVLWFRVDAADYELPVYRDEGRYVCPVLGGRNLHARDLAGIRETVCRFLAHAGYALDSEEVGVLVLRRSDLRRVPPAAVVRSLSDPGAWRPAFEWDGPDVLALLRAAGPDAFAAGVQADTWRAAEERTRHAGVHLAGRLEDAPRTLIELPVRVTANGEAVTALHEGAAITVLLAADAHALAARVGRHLSAGGFLRGDLVLEVRAETAAA